MSNKKKMQTVSLLIFLVTFIRTLFLAMARAKFYICFLLIYCINNVEFRYNLPKGLILYCVAVINENNQVELDILLLLFDFFIYFFFIVLSHFTFISDFMSVSF